MAYRFETGTSPAADIRRIAAEQVSLAQGYLNDPPGGDLHAGVHEARKCFKRLRALLRMVRPALPRPRYRLWNDRLSDAGHVLSTMRDAQVLVETFDGLESKYGPRVSFERMQPLRAKLTDDLRRIEQDRAALGARVSAVTTMLKLAALRTDYWAPADTDDGEVLGRGVQRVYRRARRQWKRARGAEVPGQLHDWRKRAKYLHYQFRLLSGEEKGWGHREQKACKALGELLGAYHDLDVLRRTLDGMEETGLDAVAECEFRALLRERQYCLYRKALRLGSVLLAQKPKRVRRRVTRRLAPSRSSKDAAAFMSGADGDRA